MLVLHGAFYQECSPFLGESISFGRSKRVSTMNELVCGIFRWLPWMVGLAAIFGSMAVASDTPSTERGAVCQDRPECWIVETLDAG